MLFDPSTRATRRIRGQAADFQQLLANLDNQTAARPGLGRIVALDDPSPTLSQIHKHIRCLCF